MPNISLSILLIPFAIFIALFLLFSVFNIFHLIRYAYKTTGFFTVILIYILGTIFLLGSSFLVLQSFNWNKTVQTKGIIAPFQGADIFLLGAPEPEEKN